MVKKIIFKWLLALAIMGVIFWISSQPSSDLPDFSWADKLVKKSGHAFEYGILATSYWYALEWKKHNRWLAWLLAVLYAATDEFHQSFVPGRHPSVWDVAIFDNIGALIALWLSERYFKQKRPDETA